MTTLEIQESVKEREPVWVLQAAYGATRKDEISSSNQSGASDTETKSGLTRRKSAPIEVEWRNISYSVSSGWRKEKKKILKNVSGKAYPGEILAILGPSGSGKSSLLNIISGYKFRNVLGKVLINGKENRQTNLSCYVMQQADVLPELTVKELITVAANLKLSEIISSKEKSNIVDELIQMLALTECMNTRSKFLSGGERKRLCIAQELVNNPPVLFLDEPTSGLDSVTCMQCIKLLKKLAQQGHTIICSIHQPSANVLNTFDKLYVLSEGDCIYKGPVSELLTYLSGRGLDCPKFHNPADFIIEIASGVYGNVIDDLKLAVKKEETRETPSTYSYLASAQERVPLEPNLFQAEAETQRYASGPWTQFKVLLLRTWRTIYRHPMLNQLRFIVHVIMGVLTGLLYWKIGNQGAYVIKNTGFLLLTLMFLIFTSTLPTILTFPLETQIFLREQHNNWYRGYVYYLTKTAADLPFQIVYTCLFCLITYWMTDQPPELFRFALYCFTCCMISILSQSVGIISGAISTVEIGILIALMIVVPGAMFSNFFVKLNDMPNYIQWLSYVSYFKYCSEILMQAVYGYDRPDFNCTQHICPYTNPAEFMEVMGEEKVVVSNDILLLFGIFFIMRVIGYLMMVVKIRYRK